MLWLTTSYSTTLILQGQAKINILGSFSGPFTLLCTFILSSWGICAHCYFCLYFVVWSLAFLSSPPATQRAPHRQTPCLACLFVSSTKAVPDVTSLFLMDVGWMNEWTQITTRNSSLLTCFFLLQQGCKHQRYGKGARVHCVYMCVCERLCVGWIYISMCPPRARHHEVSSSPSWSIFLLNIYCSYHCEHTTI